MKIILHDIFKNILKLIKPGPGNVILCQIYIQFYFLKIQLHHLHQA